MNLLRAVVCMAFLSVSHGYACDHCSGSRSPRPLPKSAQKYIGHECPNKPCPHVGHIVVDGHRTYGYHDSCGDCDCCVRSIERPLGKTGYQDTRYTTRQRQMSVRAVMGEEWWAIHGNKVR